MEPRDHGGAVRIAAEPRGVPLGIHCFTFAQGMIVDFGMTPGELKVYQRQFIANLRIHHCVIYLLIYLFK